MKIFKLAFFFILISMSLKAQQTVLKNQFSVRDFYVDNDSIYLIEKRDVKYYNFNKKNSFDNSYFIGGYGLKIFDNSKTNEIITVSNEFQQTVSSLRFYNKSSKKVEHVFYYKNGKTIDALLIPDLNYAVLSLNNNLVIIVDYNKKPSFNIVHNIPIKSLSRRLFYQNNNLFYATDLGEIFKYNLATEENTLIHNCGKRITDFTVSSNFIVYSTDKGEITKINMIDKSTASIRINDNFVLNSLQYDYNKLICGTFKGLIIVIDIDNMTLINKLNYHKRSVLKIINSNKNEFYSSSIDKTIKKWIIK